MGQFVNKEMSIKSIVMIIVSLVIVLVLGITTLLKLESNKPLYETRDQIATTGLERPLVMTQFGCLRSSYDVRQLSFVAYVSKTKIYACKEP